MSWLLALGYVGALALAGLALSVRRDPRLRGRLDALVPVRVGDLPSLGVLVGRLSTSRARAAVMARLDAAGRPPSEASSLLGRKVLLAAAGLFTGLVAPGPPVSRFGLAALLGVAGYRLPDSRGFRDSRTADIGGWPSTARSSPSG